MRLRSLFCTVALAAGASLSAQAQVSDFSVVSAPSTDPPGFVTNQLFTSFSGQLTDLQILTSGLSTGDIYQDGSGADTAPSSTFVGFIPSLASDTFVQLGSDRSDGLGSIAPGFIGGAVDIGGEAGVTFDTSLIDAAYFVPGGTTVESQTDYFVGQLTFSASSNGTASFLVNAGQQQFTATYDVVDGAIVIPEPASLALMGLGGVALVARRRRVA